MAWKKIKFLEVCDFQGGTQPPKSTFIDEPQEGYVRLVQIRDFDGDDYQTYVPNSAKLKTCHEDDILIGRYGASVGRILRGKSGAYNVALVKTLPDTTRLDKDFLFFWLNSSTFQDFIERVGSRAAQAGFNKSDFSDLQIPLPPLGEQRRIVDILNHAARIRRLREQAQAKAREIIPALFLDMFGDPATNPKGWSSCALGDVVADTQLGLVRNAREMDDDFPTPYIRMDAIRGDGTVSLVGLRKVNVSKIEKARYGLQYGDILFNTRNTRELVGKTGLYEGDGSHVFNNNIMRLRFKNDLMPRFLNAYFQTSHAVSKLDIIKSGTTTVFAIYFKNLKNMTIPIPPLEIQRRFSDLVEEIRSTSFLSARASEISEKALDALLNQAFNTLPKRDETLVG